MHRARHLLALLAAITLLAVACSDDGGGVGTADAATDTTTTPAEVPEATSTTVAEPVGEQVPRYDLQLGDCFNVYNSLNILTRVPCDQPHDREVFHTEKHPAPHGEPYPGERTMQKYAQGVCYQQFATFTGGLYETSRLEIGAFIPSQQNFEDARARYRTITCWLHGKGSKLTGSMQGRAE